MTQESDTEENVCYAVLANDEEYRSGIKTIKERSSSLSPMKDLLLVIHKPLLMDRERIDRHFMYIHEIPTDHHTAAHGLGLV